MKIELSGGWAYLIMVLSVIGLLTLVDYIFNKRIKEKIVCVGVKIRSKWKQVSGRCEFEHNKLYEKYGDFYYSGRYFICGPHDNPVIRYDHYRKTVTIGEHEEECLTNRDWNRIMKKYNLPYKL